MRENKPRLTRAATDGAVGHDVVVRPEAALRVEAPQLVGGLEASILTPGVLDRHEYRPGHVPAALIACRWQRRPEAFAGVFRRGTHVHQANVRLANRLSQLPL